MTIEELREAVERGTIDTVLLAMTDMQGRLQGKRLTATHFLAEVLEHGAEGCNYLLAVDVDMATVDGYAMASWEGGYGDMVMVPPRFQSPLRVALVSLTTPNDESPTTLITELASSVMLPLKKLAPVR